MKQDSSEIPALNSLDIMVWRCVHLHWQNRCKKCGCCGLKTSRFFLEILETRVCFDNVTLSIKALLLAVDKTRILIYHSIITALFLEIHARSLSMFCSHDVVTLNEQFLLSSRLNIAHKLAFSLSLELLNLKCNSLNMIFSFFRVQLKLVRRLWRLESHWITMMCKFVCVLLR